MQNTKRARSTEAKQERLRHIIDASSMVLSHKMLNDFTMADVVESTKLSKPAIYNYFATKEEILLQIYRDELRAWLDGMVSCVTASEVALDKRAFDELFVDSFCAASLLVKLTPQLTSTLEQNVSVGTYCAFKKETAKRMNEFAALLVSTGLCDAVQAQGLALGYMTILVGALQVSAPAPFSDDELHHETVAFLKMMDFKTNCLASLSLLKV